MGWFIVLNLVLSVLFFGFVDLLWYFLMGLPCCINFVSVCLYFGIRLLCNIADLPFCLNFDWYEYLGAWSMIAYCNDSCTIDVVTSYLLVCLIYCFDLLIYRF